MREKSYFPDLVVALEETLRRLEESEAVPADDPKVAELKKSILLKIAEHDTTFPQKALRDHGAFVITNYQTQSDS
jgi:hypothetical protein